MAGQNVIVTKVSSSDVDEHAASLAEWNQRYLQMARGPFSGRLKHIEINDGLKIFRETTNIKISEHFVTPENRVSLALPLPGSAPVRCCHGEAQPGDVIIFRPGESYHLECRGAFDVLGIEVKSDETSLDFGQGIEIVKAEDLVRDFLVATIERLDRDCGNVSADIPAQVTEMVLERCLSLSQPGHQIGRSPRACSRSQLVARARKIIELGCQDPMSVHDLARSLNVSTRTLEYSFHDVLGTTPAAYIKIVRLHEARRDIRGSERARKVTDVAVDWGFWHFGRFASDYRKLFGELPSETRTARRALDS